MKKLKITLILKTETQILYCKVKMVNKEKNIYA